MVARVIIGASAAATRAVADVSVRAREVVVTRRADVLHRPGGLSGYTASRVGVRIIG